jgi:hypothetical protein
VVYSNEFDTTGTGGWGLASYPTPNTGSVAPSWSNTTGYPYSGAGALTSTLAFATGALKQAVVLYTSGTTITSFVGTTLNVEVYVSSPTADIQLQLYIQSYVNPTYAPVYSANVTVAAGAAPGWHALTFVAPVASGNWTPTSPNALGVQVTSTAAQTLTVGFDHVSLTQ